MVTNEIPILTFCRLPWFQRFIFIEGERKNKPLVESGN
jgi:hypothetical protein